jgi:Protein of unknown function (DUF4038)
VSAHHLRMGGNRHPHARLVPVALFAVVLLVFHSFGLAADQAVDHASTFPLKVSADGRHLADRSGRPFLVVGDTAWSLVAQLGEDDTARYLDDRSRRGFTAIIVNLIEHKFATNAPADQRGMQPFRSPGDFAHPDAAYFDAAHRVIEEAGRLGIAVWLCPAYLGWKGGDEGFFKEIVHAGPDALRQYGRFVGARFKDLHNIVWMLGGDYALSPAERWVADDLAAGLLEGEARQIMTAHGGQTTAVTTYGQRPWLAVETVYSYKPDLGPELLAAFRAQPIRPFVLIESTYEGEHDVTPAQIRRQAWTAMVSGAAGQFFGNNPIWHFDGPTLFAFSGDWRQALDSRGSQDMARLAAFLRARAWHALAPRHDLVMSSTVDGDGRASAAAAPDGSFVVYVPADGTARPSRLTLTLPSLPAAARWFNPARDEPERPVVVTETGKGRVVLRTPGDNGTGANDWVLTHTVKAPGGDR